MDKLKKRLDKHNGALWKTPVLSQLHAPHKQPSILLVMLEQCENFCYGLSGCDM